VTKDHLAQTVWPGTHVGDDSLTKVIRELRRVLGDDQRAPRFIATVHTRGYRFVLPAGDLAVASSPALLQPLIGREPELAQLTSWLDAARHGERQVCFIGGDVGIGKSTLVSAFLDAVRPSGAAAVHVALGQCVEQYGGAEPFLPVISALRRLTHAASAAAILRRSAPPWLLAACGLAASAAAPHAASRAGVLRTLAEAVEDVAGQTPLVFVLEDLHWSDPSTVDFVNLLARRNDPARLLVICTSRQGEAIAAGHPSGALVRELRRTKLCREITLGGLASAAVRAYLVARLGDGELPADAAAYLLHHTGGNPFFLGALIDDLLARGALSSAGQHWQLCADEAPAIPSGSLAALAPRLERLTSPERAILEAASVVGDRFAAEPVAVVAAETDAGASLEAVEGMCERLARHHDILHGGTNGAPYSFRHALYRRALYDGITPARRRRMHARLGEFLAAARPDGCGDGAAELAQHFAQAGDHIQAARYHAEAAEAARARFADREVATHLGATLAHLRSSPHTPERDLRELMLLHQHAAALLAVNGFDDPAVTAAYREGQALARRMHVPLVEFAANAGLLFLHLMRAELNAASALAAELSAVAPSLPLPECQAAAQAATGTIAYARGDLAAAKRHLAGLRGHFPRRDATAAFDPAVWHLGMLGLVHAGLGEVAAARATGAELLACTAGAAPADVASAHMLVASIEAHFRTVPLVLEHATRAADIAADFDLPILVSAAGHLRGWAIAASGDPQRGLPMLIEGEAAFRASGQRLGSSFIAVLRAEASLCAGDCAAADAAIRAGLEHAHATGERYQDGDLHRLRAECLRRAGRIDQAATALHAALKIAAAQGARTAELRAAIDSLRLNQATGLMRNAGKRLRTVAAWFGTGVQFADLSIAEGFLKGENPPPAVPLAAAD